MQAIINYLKQYLYEVNKTVLWLTSLLTALLIYLNYHYIIDDTISNSYSPELSFLSRYFIFLIAFSVPYLITVVIKRNNFLSPPFYFLVLLAPAIFSFKVAVNFNLDFSAENKMNAYWYYISYWPLLVIITAGFLFIIWRVFHRDQGFYGIKTKNIDWKPYWLMLLIMLPLVIVASTQADFLTVYPKMKLIGELEDFSLWQKILFELSYGSDFITIELFFRGFLILGFIKWAGKDAILPMACFYCTIHFGKPLGECISSYFGGLILGVVVYHTRSILGGLIVHLGIAWMMEIGGHLGNQLFKTTH